jgi:putative ABC transport system permease protein
MQDIFGLPVQTLMTALLALFLLGAAIVTVLAARNTVMFKMGVRNVPRRRAQTALIVLGLMLATLLFSASFTTGDTLVHSNRVRALSTLGEVDIQVQSTRGAASQLDQLLGSGGRAAAYFDQTLLDRVRRALENNAEVEGVAPLVSESAPVLAPESKLSEPQVSLLGVDAESQAGFDRLKQSDGAELSVRSLADGQVYISETLATEIGLRVGDDAQVFLSEKPTLVTVRGIYSEGGVPATANSLVMPLERMQELTGNVGRINSLLITHRGDEIGDAEHTDGTLAALQPLLRGSGLEASPVKRDALERADREGGGFADIFTLFGGFSIAAGVLLIFLIFVMLAAERKRELGIARGVGMQRRHLVRMFTFEGAVYSLLAAAVGSVLGVAVGWLMVRVITAAFAQFNQEIVFDFQWSSLVIAYTLGMVITFAVVVVSSWRASRLNIVRAIRDIPEPRTSRRTWKGLVGTAALLFTGALLTVSGLSATSIALFMLGTSLLVIGAALLVRRLGVPDRVAFTVAGVALLVWWLLPNSVSDAILPALLDDTGGIEMFFISGIMIVIAAVWTVIYNSDLLLRLIVAVFGRVRGLPPVLKTSVSYPMQNRFRTGMTLAMISLVMFTLVVMSFITNAFAGIWDDTQRWSGGFDIRASTSYTNPVPDMTTAVRTVDGVKSGDIAAVGGFSSAPIKAKAAGTDGDPANLNINAADAAYTNVVSYAFGSRAAAYKSDRAVWQALKSEENTAVVSAITVPPRVNQEFGEQPPPVRLSGFFREDPIVPENTYIEAQDPRTGRVQRLRVIGVLDDVALYTGDVLVSQSRLEGLIQAPVPAQSYFYKLRPGVDAVAATKALEARFLANGMQAESIREEIDTFAGTNTMINTLLQGFMGLGLIVGIAALGVIAARAVVERRQQIGVLRAMGFQRGQVQLSFLLESSFVALLGIGIGIALGIGLSRNVIGGFAEQFPGVRYEIPWLQLLVLAGLAYLSSLLTTYLPARQASRILPAEALRFE